MAVPNPVNGVPFIYRTRPTRCRRRCRARTLSAPAQNEVAGPSNLDHVVKDKTVKYIDIEFDRKVSSPTFTATDVLHVIGPFGRIVGTAAEPIPRRADQFPRRHRGKPALSTSKYFREYFPTQKFNGSYRIQLGPNILDSDLNKLDSNVNAGVDNLTGRTSGGIASTGRADDGRRRYSAPGGQDDGRADYSQRRILVAESHDPDSHFASGRAATGSPADFAGRVVGSVVPLEHRLQRLESRQLDQYDLRRFGAQPDSGRHGSVRERGVQSDAALGAVDRPPGRRSMETLDYEHRH